MNWPAAVGVVRKLNVIFGGVNFTWRSTIWTTRRFPGGGGGGAIVVLSVRAFLSGCRCQSAQGPVRVFRNGALHFCARSCHGRSRRVAPRHSEVAVVPQRARSGGVRERRLAGFAATIASGQEVRVHRTTSRARRLCLRWTGPVSCQAARVHDERGQWRRGHDAAGVDIATEQSQRTRENRWLWRAICRSIELLPGFNAPLRCAHAGAIASSSRWRYFPGDTVKSRICWIWRVEIKLYSVQMN